MPQEFSALGKTVKAEHVQRLIEGFPTPKYVNTVTMVSDEFTAVCPITGQPDLYNVEISYNPDEWCIESKSLKLYLWTFRNEGAFVEQLASTIAEDVMTYIHPHFVRVTLVQKARGGIEIRPQVEIFRDSL